jgi:hypothetical protein
LIGKNSRLFVLAKLTGALLWIDIGEYNAFNKRVPAVVNQKFAGERSPIPTRPIVFC